MARTDAFQVEGVVLEVLANGTYRLELANGHRPLGFVARRSPARFAPGERVKLNLSPYDLSAGRIMVEESRKPN